MKISTLITLLRDRNQDDEVLIPCDSGALTDEIRVMPLSIGNELSTPRRVALLPLEGAWTMHLCEWQRVETTTPRPGAG